MLAARPEFEKHVIGQRLAVIAETGATMNIGGEGLVIGRLHDQGQGRPLAAIDDDASRAMLASRGRSLIDAHWGAYVAFLTARARASVEIVRAPLGDLPCLIFSSVLGMFVASDIDLLTAFAGLVPEVDWMALTHHLAAPDLPRRRTCLKGVDELRGGEQLSDNADGRVINALWPIWNFAGADHRFVDERDAARHVRDAVHTGVSTRAHPHGRIILRLSGGLDSSIVAACLADADRDVVALTLVTHDRSGDERLHARAVAAHLGVPLIEAMRAVADVDLEASAAHGLPRPSTRGFTQASARLAVDVARDHGATAIFDGGGGDNMFASLQSLAPVVDCLRRDGGPFWRTARSIGIAAQTSTLEVAWRAVVRSWSRGPSFRWPVDLRLFSANARAVAAGADNHPWLVPPPDALAGSAAHIALLAAADSVAQGRDPRQFLGSVSPLIAQPVAEACLRVPSWFWTREGHNRVIARDAFRNALPPAIVDRRDKGAPDSFVIELIEANHALIVAMLTEGLLVRRGLIDRVALTVALAPANLAKGYGYARIMQLVDAEAWVQSWSWASGRPS